MNAMILAWKRLIERVLLGAAFKRLYGVVGGHIFFQTANAAVRLDLFTALARSPGLTRAEIAARLGIQEKPARILLLGCASLGLLKKKGDGYYVTRLSRELLSRDSPRNIAAIMAWQDQINYLPMASLYDAIRDNSNVGLKHFQGDEGTLYERLVHHPELQKIFQDAMHAISVQANHLLIEHIDFSRYRHVVDIGGGDGTNAMALARKYPGLRASVFDSPSVCAIARSNFAQSGMADRLGAFEGNCFETPFPTGADCFLFCHFMTIWSEERDVMLLRKAFDVLPPGGSAVIFNMMQHDNEDGPLSAAMGSPYFLALATGEGMLYTWKEYEQFMRQAGFARVTRHTLVRDHGAIIGTKAS